MILSTILILLITLAVGLPLVLLACPKINRVAAIGLSYPLGIGIFTLLMFLTNIAGIRFSLLNELMLLFLVSIPLVFLVRGRMQRFFVEVIHSFKKMSLSLVEKVMLGAMAFIVISSFINTFYWPVHIWDSIVLYDFRAHVFANTGFIKEIFFDGYYLSYPLLTSLAHTIIYLAGGKYPQFLHSLFYLSLGVSFYGFVREFTSRKIGLLSTFILLITGPLFYHSLLSLTNLPFSVYLAMGAICIYLWDQKKQLGYLILSALLIGLSTWTRSVEPFWLALLSVILVVSIYRKKIWSFVIFSLLFFPIRETWDLSKNLLKTEGSMTAVEGIKYAKVFSSLFDVTKWMQVFQYLYKNVVTAWGGIFAAFILATIAPFLLRRQKELFLIFFITLALIAVLIFGTFAFSQITDYWYRIGDATERLSMLFYPLFTFCVALIMQELANSRK